MRKLNWSEARRQLIESDQLIAEASAEFDKPTTFGAKGTGRYRTISAVMRYSGTGVWEITQASQVRGFFSSKFGRQLPISALGQSNTHNRLGFDHRNSVDVAVHPDSAEGKALIEYLRNSGIPFHSVAIQCRNRAYSHRIRVNKTLTTNYFLKQRHPHVVIGVQILLRRLLYHRSIDLPVVVRDIPKACGILPGLVPQRELIHR
jgi:hypothetical protein